MPPRVRLSAEEAERLPELLSRVASLRSDFPADAEASAQAVWVHDRYSTESPLTLNLLTLLLFEHGVHRSIDQVARDLAILREDTDND